MGKPRKTKAIANGGCSRCGKPHKMNGPVWKITGFTGIFKGVYCSKRCATGGY